MLIPPEADPEGDAVKAAPRSDALTVAPDTVQPRLAAEVVASRRLPSEHQARHERARRVEVVAGVVLVVAIVGFIGLALLARTTPYFWFDVPIELAIQKLTWPPFQTLLWAISWIGLPPESNYIFGALIVVLALIGRRWEAAGLLVAAIGSISLFYLVAPLVARPRPTPDLVNVVGQIGYGSFPSGHVTNLTAIFGFLCFLAYTSLRPSWWRTLLLVACVTPVVSVGVARISVGQHWPSDVLGGYLLGSIWLAVTIWLYRRAKQSTRHGLTFWRHPNDAVPNQISDDGEPSGASTR
jgi:undecaprenyl-diphosphatase